MFSHHACFLSRVYLFGWKISLISEKSCVVCAPCVMFSTLDMRSDVRGDAPRVYTPQLLQSGCCEHRADASRNPKTLSTAELFVSRAQRAPMRILRPSVVGECMIVNTLFTNISLPTRAHYNSTLHLVNPVSANSGVVDRRAENKWRKRERQSALERMGESEEGSEKITSGYG